MFIKQKQPRFKSRHPDSSNDGQRPWPIPTPDLQHHNHLLSSRMWRHRFFQRRQIWQPNMVGEKIEEQKKVFWEHFEAGNTGSCRWMNLVSINYVINIE